MRDIGVYTTRDTWEHKRREGSEENDIYCYWTLPSIGEGYADLEGARLWMAFEGRWRGYFIIHAATPEEVRFWSETWCGCNGPERKPFQGFTYKCPQLRFGQGGS